jgi:hypothetical protein
MFTAPDNTAGAVPVAGGVGRRRWVLTQSGKEDSAEVPDLIPYQGRADRRAAVRFPIEQDVRYKIFKGRTMQVGYGKTINVSSNGILFTTERPLAFDERVEVAVNWPAFLNNKCPLKLVTRGRIVRSEDGRAAVAIEHYEFRTQGIHASPAHAPVKGPGDAVGGNGGGNWKGSAGSNGGNR